MGSDLIWKWKRQAILGGAEMSLQGVPGAFTPLGKAIPQAECVQVIGVECRGGTHCEVRDQVVNQRLGDMYCRQWRPRLRGTS
jgi:hypothetical protein